MTSAISDIKKPRGRPKADTSPVMLRIPAGDLEGLDAFAAAQEDHPSRPEAIRRLIRDRLAELGYLEVSAGAA